MDDAQSRLVARHLDLVRRIAGRVHRDLGCDHVDFDDLVAFGHQGLVEAASRYDPGRGIAFAGFAYYRIRGAIYDGVRIMGSLPSSVYRQLLARQRAEQYLEAQGQRARMDAGGASSAGSVDTATSARALARTMRSLAAIYVISAAAVELEHMAGPDPGALLADEALALKEERSRLRHAIARLPERERHVIERCYFEGATLGQAGDELGLSPSWTSRLHARAVDRLRDLLADTSG